MGAAVDVIHNRTLLGLKTRAQQREFQGTPQRGVIVEIRVVSATAINVAERARQTVSSSRVVEVRLLNADPRLNMNACVALLFRSNGRMTGKSADFEIGATR